MSARTDIIDAINALNGVDDSHVLSDADLDTVQLCVIRLHGYRLSGAHAAMMRSVSLYTNLGHRTLYDYVEGMGGGMCGMALTGDLRAFRAALQQGGGCCACVIL